MTVSSCSCKRHRFPPEIIARAVWLYYRYPLSLRLVEEMLLERGVVVSYDTIRRWGHKFGGNTLVGYSVSQPARMMSGIWMIALTGRVLRSKSPRGSSLCLGAGNTGCR